MCIHVCLISRMKFDYKKMVERKLFFQIQSINILNPYEEKIIVVPIMKRMEIVMSIQVCPVSWVNFDYEENGGKKAFPENPKYQYHVSQYGELDCCDNNKENGDYHAHPCLSHFMDEL